MTLLKNSEDKPGIAIVGLSSGVIDGKEIEYTNGLTALQDRGFSVFNYYHHERKNQRFAGTNQDRLAQLNDALENSEVQTIMALRGGYGISRLLDKIDFEKIVSSEKILVGHSDFNALQLAMLAKTGAKSICGPMVCDDFSRPDLSIFTLDHFFNCLNRHEYSYHFQTMVKANVEAEGVLWGGNLSMLTHLLGTEYFPKIENGILFIEDIAEHPYRVERMMLQLFHSGILAKQRAVIFGDFSAYRLAIHDNGYNFEEMLSFLRKTINLPIIDSLPFGHIKDKFSLVIGSNAKLIQTNYDVTLTMTY